MTNATATTTRELRGAAPRSIGFRSDPVTIGEEMGFYRAMSASPLTAEQLARRTGVEERSLSRWLEAQAAAGYLYFDSRSGTYANYCTLPRAA